MNKQHTIDKYMARLLMVSFFLPAKVVPPIIMTASLYFLISSIVLKETAPPKNLVWALLLGSGYLLFLFAVPLTLPANRHILGILIELRSSQIIAPVLFALISPAALARIRNELVFFAYACCACCIFGNTAFIYQAMQTVNGLHSLSHVAYRIYFESFTGLHPTYMAMYQCFGISIILVSRHSKSKAVRIFHLVVLYSLVLFSLALFAKSPFIALIIILAHFSYIHRRQLYSYGWFISGMVLVFVAAYSFIPFFSQRLNEIFNIFDHSRPNGFNNNSVYTRKLIWHTDVSMLRRYWLTGVGPARLQQLLDMRYLFYSIYHNNFPGFFDPHNEYLWQWLAFGVIGIIITLSVLVTHFIKAIKNKDNLYLYFMLVIAITFSTESVIARQPGVLFFSIFTSLFFFTSGKVAEKK